MRFLYYIACIGNPDLDKKMDILLHNLQYIHNDIKCNFDICINCYEDNESIYTDIFNRIKSVGFIDTIYKYVRKGILTELFLRNPYNKFVDNYDYIMFIMDDVRIVDINIIELIRIKKLLNISIISPKILYSTYPYMYIHNDITINNFLEVYLLLLSPLDFKQFIGLYTIENRWMWGVDLLFGYYNIPTGVVNKFVAIHELPSKAYNQDGMMRMFSYMCTHTPFNSKREILDKYTPIKYRYDDMGTLLPGVTLYENFL